MSTISRTLSNLRKVGIKADAGMYLTERSSTWLTTPLLTNSTSVRFLDYPPNHSLTSAGDTKAGRLIGTDRAGNKFFENNEELPLRTRWVEYAKHDYDAAHIEPGWHAWISYSVDKPPTEDPLLQAGVRAFEPSRALPNFTQTRGAFKTYNTSKSKISAWEPVAAPRA
ncbi:nadh-ubiquinone oxidoreductase subunit [Fusarium pseudocircinatum]|uniref:NADH dehydrogenase [ubiquinone] 1 alpha subcomplex subunit n=1 Tax=Fusarium pseudocircinatum TaxID=56676 RepID=A0A8H5LBT7_9HYPO|nr:nadh-ubiquinone oxidoreductase subunit [Fusarium pseudocircinatum]